MLTDVDKILRDFLSRFGHTSSCEEKTYKYCRALQAIDSRLSRSLVIELDDLISHYKDMVHARSNYANYTHRSL